MSKSNENQLIFGEAGGAKVEINLEGIQANEKQQQILKKLSQNNDLSDLLNEEREEIRDLRSLLGRGGGQDALIVRFDLTWVRIDERRSNLP